MIYGPLLLLWCFSAMCLQGKEGAKLRSIAPVTLNIVVQQCHELAHKCVLLFHFFSFLSLLLTHVSLQMIAL
ncbi:hypothetical protein AHAS_Ahas12G0205400 [Arachis hypogaea]